MNGLVIYDKKVPLFNESDLGQHKRLRPVLFIDETGMWLFHRESAINPQSRDYMLQLIDPHDFRVIYQKTIRRIATGRTAWFMLCGKLYCLSSDTVYVYDINNNRNTISYASKVQNSLVRNLMYADVHYNPRMKQLYANMFDRYYRYNLTSCNFPLPESRLSTKSVFHKWTVQPKQEAEYSKLVGQLERYTAERNVFAQTYAANQIARCPTEICWDPDDGASLYCRIKKCAANLKILTDYKQSMVAGRKILQTEFHMHRILEQTTLHELSLQIAELRHFTDRAIHNLTDEFTVKFEYLRDELTYKLDHLTYEMAVRFDELTDELRDKFYKLTAQVNKFKNQLGSYFNTLAQYDKKKAEADVEFISDRLMDYRRRLQESARKLERKLNSMFDYAQYAVTKEADGTAFNAIFKLIVAIPSAYKSKDPTGILDALFGGAQDVASSLVPAEQLADLKLKILPLITRLFQNVSVVIRQESISKMLNAAQSQFLNNTNLKGYYMPFLKEYKSYDPPITAGMIAQFETVLELTVDKLCEFIFHGNTLPSSISQYKFATKAGCLSTKKDVAVMAAYYQEYYQFLYDVLEAMASYVRASIAMESSQSLMDIETELDKTERDFTQARSLPERQQARSLPERRTTVYSQIRCLTKMRIHSLEIYIQSEMQLRMAIYEACSLIEYNRGGVIPEYCHQLHQDPYNKAEYKKLVAYRLEDVCSNDQVIKYVRIPAAYPTSNQPVPRGTIDLASLYSGNFTSFQIPNRQWLIENHWLGEYDAGNAWFIKRFELFLPYASSDRLQVQVTKVMMGHNAITPRGTLYDFTTPVRFDLRHLENAHSCYNSIVDLDHPYQTPGCEKPSQICIISRGENENAAFHASVYSRWSLALKVDDGNLTPVDPVGDFYLQAGIILCKVSNVPNRATVPVRHARASGRQAVCCADSSQYFDQARGTCANCPDHGCVKFGGYFCGNCTTPWQ